MIIAANTFWGIICVKKKSLTSQTHPSFHRLLTKETCLRQGLNLSSKNVYLLFWQFQQLLVLVRHCSSVLTELITHHSSVLTELIIHGSSVVITPWKSSSSFEVVTWAKFMILDWRHRFFNKLQVFSIASLITKIPNIRDDIITDVRVFCNFLETSRELFSLKTWIFQHLYEPFFIGSDSK